MADLHDVLAARRQRVEEDMEREEGTGVVHAIPVQQRDENLKHGDVLLPTFLSISEHCA